MRRRRSLAAIFALPALIAVASLVGLVAGLAGEGAADFLAWAGLAIPLLALGWAWTRSRLSHPPRPARALQHSE